MNLILGLLVIVIGNLLVVGGAIAAYRDSFFFISQMRGKGIQHGFPYVIHGGMWSDLLLISPLLGIIVTAYGAQWSPVQWGLLGLGALAISFVLHFGFYLRVSFQGFWGYQGKLTLSGWLHLIYTAYALTIFGLFYFATVHIDHTFLIVTSVLLALHILISKAGQIIANIYDSAWLPDESYKNVFGWTLVLLIWLFVFWRCWVLWAL